MNLLRIVSENMGITYLTDDTLFALSQIEKDQTRDKDETKTKVTVIRDGLGIDLLVANNIDELAATLESSVPGLKIIRIE